MVSLAFNILALLLVMCSCSFAEGTIVYVANNGTNSSSCIKGGRSEPCSSFNVAMKLLASDKHLNEEVSVLICDDQTVLPQTYFLSINTSFMISSCEDGYISLVCSDNGKQLIFANNLTLVVAPKGSLGLKGLQWMDCLSDTNAGLQIIGFQEVNISNCISQNSSGLKIVNIQRLTVEGSNFLGSRMTPSAVLLVVGSDASVDQFHFDIRDCSFNGSRRGSKEVSVSEESGILVFPLAKANASYHIVITNCTFSNNSARFLKEIPIIHVPQNVSLSLQLTSCHFYHNRFTFLFLLDSNLNGAVSFQFDDVHFYGHYGALSICSSGYKNKEQFGLDTVDGNIKILLENCTFEKCENECLIVKLDFKFVMKMRNCSFKDSEGEDSSVIISCSRLGERGCKDANVTLRDLKVLKNVNGPLLSMLYGGGMVPEVAGMVPEVAVMEITGVHLLIRDSVFSHNIGTGLALCSVSVTAVGNVVFRKNYGIAGGGLLIKKPLHGGRTTFNLSNNLTNISFDNNYAYYGGAVYVNDAEFLTPCQAAITFYKNSARASGQAVYIVGELSNFSCSVELSDDDVSTSPMNMTVDVELDVVPGVDIVLDLNITDKDGKASACYAGIDLFCSDHQNRMRKICTRTNHTIALVGPPFPYLTSSKVNTSLQLSLSQPGPYLDFDVYLLVYCLTSNDADSLSQSVMLNLAACPDGFQFDSVTGMCQCPGSDDTHDNFQCDINKGVACVRKGYWAGTSPDGDGKLIQAPCSNRHCNFSLRPCLMTPDFLQLGLINNSQCVGNHTGLLCSQCQENTSFTFEALLCVADSTCSPYSLLAFAVVIQVVLSLALILVLKLRLSVGTGYLYGPLFFLSVVSQLPFEYNQHYYYLGTVISAYVSVLHLNLKILGYIPWCFIKSLGALHNYAFHFLGPSIVALVVIMVVLVAQKCPKVLYPLQSSPLQVLCLLALLSFWSVADTCTTILGFSTFEGLSGTRVFLQPDLIYFGWDHAPFAVVSILLLLIAVIPFILLLLLPPLLAHRVNFSRIKPILDEFQSCYKDRYRWFSAVYSIAWLVILTARLTPMMVEAVVVVVATGYFIIHPYQSLWLNTVDTVLLVELVLLTGLVNGYEIMRSSGDTSIFIHVLIAFSLAYITILLGVMCFGWIGKVHWKCQKKLFRSNGSTHHVVTSTEVHLSKSCEEEREPLLRVLSEQPCEEWTQ